VKLKKGERVELDDFNWFFSRYTTEGGHIMPSRKRKLESRIIVGLMSLLGVVIFIPIAQAQQIYDICECYSFTLKPLFESEGMTALGYEATGIARSYHENKVFDNFTLHNVGNRQITDGKGKAHGYFKYLDPDGDLFVMEGIAEGADVTMTFIHGTGKWKGIKGEGKIRLITGGKPILPGTAQRCYRHAGSFELLKK